MEQEVKTALINILHAAMRSAGVEVAVYVQKVLQHYEAQGTPLLMLPTAPTASPQQ